MSSAQATLTDFGPAVDTVSRTRERVTFESEQNTCENCGRDVDPQVVRVVGDGGTVPGCVACQDSFSDRGGRRFTTTTSFVRAIMTGRVSK
jgi:hypothetical protein